MGATPTIPHKIMKTTTRYIAKRIGTSYFIKSFKNREDAEKFVEEYNYDKRSWQWLEVEECEFDVEPSDVTLSRDGSIKVFDEVIGTWEKKEPRKEMGRLKAAKYVERMYFAYINNESYPAYSVNELRESIINTL